LPGIPARTPTELSFFAVSQTFTVAHGFFFGTALASALETSTATAASNRTKGTQRIPPDPKEAPLSARQCTKFASPLSQDGTNGPRRLDRQDQRGYVRRMLVVQAGLQRNPRTTLAEMPKSAPFSMRLSAEFDLLIVDEAHRTKRSKGAIVEALAEEAMHMRLFPGIAFKGTDWDRRAWIIGTGFDVWQVIDVYRDFESVEHMAASFSLEARHIELALAYYERFPQEIDVAIASNRRPLSELRAEYPFIAVRGDES
jgi:uncharacterized protein (DUF433 family)